MTETVNINVAQQMLIDHNILLVCVKYHDIKSIIYWINVNLSSGTYLFFSCPKQSPVDEGPTST